MSPSLNSNYGGNSLPKNVSASLLAEERAAFLLGENGLFEAVVRLVLPSVLVRAVRDFDLFTATVVVSWVGEIGQLPGN